MHGKRSWAGAALAAGTLAATLVSMPTPAVGSPVTTGTTASSAATTDYVVLRERGASRAAALAAIKAAGGRIVKENRALGTVTVTAPANGFIAAVSKSDAVVGAARNRIIGRSPQAKAQAKVLKRAMEIEREHHYAVGYGGARTSSAGATAASTAGMDPLDRKLWGLRMVRSDLARTKNAGDRRVKVGILDTGIDRRNPDIAPNFSARLSRNFAPDIPEFDGPCEFRGCLDPAGWDDGGHGTHVAGTVGAAANGFGISGVAPNITLVNIRGGQDSGYFFLGPVTDALTYGGDAGLDVINMSFFVDPWLYNCRNNPADTPEQQAEQRTIIAAMNRALTYAHDKGVTLVGALGNNHEDLGNPRTDVGSPNPGIPHERPIDNESCFDLPVEGPYVLGITALGPSGVKSDYSNYGTEQADFSAPGGFYRDYFGTDLFKTNENLILSSYPFNALRAEGLVDDRGNITPLGAELGTLKRCPAGVTDFRQCGYYTYLQGTSMAAPHASGVAALVVSQHGSVGTRGYGLNPGRVRRILAATAADRACPEPRTVDYLDDGRDEEYTATCRGSRDVNGFYGEGIVDAWRAVTYRG